MSITQKADVTWSGPIKEGSGIINSGSGTLKNIAYSYNTRFENVKGTNPEELIAAAHAACFSMALSGNCGKKGFEVKEIKTVATVSLDKIGGQWTVVSSHLEVEADISNVSESEFQNIAEETRVGCPISRLLKAQITMSAKLANLFVPIPPDSEYYSQLL